ncbi:hypothetical protein ACS0TY_034628 [Phlomoides rotata]
MSSSPLHGTNSNGLDALLMNLLHFLNLSTMGNIPNILAKFIIKNMLTHAMRKRVVIFLVEELINRVFIIYIILSYMISVNNVMRVRRRVVDAQTYDMLSRIPDHVGHMNRLFLLSDADCISNLRMDRNSFARLCSLMRELCGLVDHMYVSVEEQVSMFLSIIAHYKKNIVVKFDYRRSR